VSVLSQFALATYEDASKDLCGVKQLPFKVADNKLVKVGRADYSSNLGTFASAFELINKSEKKIVQVYATVDYLDAEGSTLFSHTYRSLTEPDDETVLPELYKGLPYSGFDDPVPYGEKFQMGGGGPPRTRACPASMKLAGIDLQYEDRSWQGYHDPGWVLEPRPISRHSKRLEGPPFTEKELPFIVDCDISISATGEVNANECRSSSSGKELEWIKKEIRSWVFHPGLVDGQPHAFSFTTLIYVASFKTNDELESPKKSNRAYLEAIGTHTKLHSSFVVVNMSAEDERLSQWFGYWDGLKPLYGLNLGARKMGQKVEK
jgi:hypothetical protein